MPGHRVNNLGMGVHLDEVILHAEEIGHVVKERTPHAAGPIVLSRLLEPAQVRGKSRSIRIRPIEVLDFRASSHSANTPAPRGPDPGAGYRTSVFPRDAGNFPPGPTGNRRAIGGAAPLRCRSGNRHATAARYPRRGFPNQRPQRSAGVPATMARIRSRLFMAHDPKRQATRSTITEKSLYPPGQGSSILRRIEPQKRNQHEQRPDQDGIRTRAAPQPAAGQRA